MRSRACRLQLDSPPPLVCSFLRQKQRTSTDWARTLHLLRGPANPIQPQGEGNPRPHGSCIVGAGCAIFRPDRPFNRGIHRPTCLFSVQASMTQTFSPNGVRPCAKNRISIDCRCKAYRCSGVIRQRLQIMVHGVKAKVSYAPCEPLRTTQTLYRKPFPATGGSA